MQPSSVLPALPDPPIDAPDSRFASTSLPFQLTAPGPRPAPGAAGRRLVAAASGLLLSAVALRDAPAHPRPLELRDELLRALARFAAQAERAGVRARQVDVARYALCTLLDELIAQTPWGSACGWMRQSLLVTSFHESFGGETFFRWLDRAMSEPRTHLELLELMHLLLALGLQGRYRLLEDGPARLDALRSQLHALLRRERGAPEAALSAPWRPAPPAPLPLGQRVSAWMIVAALAAMLCGVHAVLAIRLAQASDLRFAARLAVRAASPPPGPPRAAMVPDAIDPPRAAPVSSTAPDSTLRSLLAAEISAGHLDVRETAAGSTVVFHGDALFDVGRADPRPSFEAPLARVAQALDRLPGAIVVSGHTDDTPVARSARFPSNFELSVARAQAVARRLAPWLRESPRLQLQGVADTEPRASNATPEGRALNRRVEITLRPLE